MRKPDKYKNFAELKRSEPPEAWAISRAPRDSKVLIIAPHGSRIEPGTSRLAALIAGRLQSEREQLRSELVQARAELKAVAGLREPLEAYLREHARVSATQVRAAQAKGTRVRKQVSRRGARLRSKRVSDS